MKEHILPFILKDGSFSTSAEVAVKNAFLGLDIEFAEACKLDNSLHSGTTVLTALLQGRLFFDISSFYTATLNFLWKLDLSVC